MKNWNEKIGKTGGKTVKTVKRERKNWDEKTEMETVKTEMKTVKTEMENDKNW